MSTPEATTEPTRTARQEFVRALVEHSWARPAAPRPAARPHIVLMVAAIATAAAVAVGAVLQWMHPIHPPRAAAPPPPPAPAAPFTAVTGWDWAGGPPGYGFNAQGRTDGWDTGARGGWGQEGLH